MTTEQKRIKLVNEAQQLDREAGQYQLENNEVLRIAAEETAKKKRLKAKALAKGGE